jgi:hypothetical protein
MLRLEKDGFRHTDRGLDDGKHRFNAEDHSFHLNRLVDEMEYFFFTAEKKFFLAETIVSMADRSIA